MAAGAPRQDQCVAEMAGSQLGETQVKKEEGKLRGPPRKAVEVSKVQDTQSVAGGGGPEHSDGSEGGRGRQVQCCFSSRLSRTLWQKCLESPIHGPGEQCLPVTLVTCENTFLPSQSPPCLSLASSFLCLEPCGPFSPRGTCLLLCLQVAYGTTENSPVTFMGFPNDSIARKTETVGCVFPHTEVTVTLPTCSRSSACSRPQPTLPVWRWSRCMPSCLAQTSPPKLLFFFSTAGKN